MSLRDRVSRVSATPVSTIVEAASGSAFQMAVSPMGDAASAELPRMAVAAEHYLHTEAAEPLVYTEVVDISTATENRTLDPGRLLTKETAALPEQLIRNQPSLAQVDNPLPLNDSTSNQLAPTPVRWATHPPGTPWPADLAPTMARVAAMKVADLPRPPFALKPGITVRGAVPFLHQLQLAAAHGPGHPRARFGALQSDCRELLALLDAQEARP